MKQQPMKEIELQYWPYKDGTIGAFITDIPGSIWARTMDHLVAGMKHLTDVMGSAKEQILANPLNEGLIDLQAEMELIDGRICIRWPGVVGFGLDFASQEEMQEFVQKMLVFPTPEEFQTSRKTALN